ncbi:DUF2200 family protein [Altererythrobacter lauratis]|uniref:DUF2200 family protein n=1 Tax=Alteraurantiacibacter lauratis TaxID=2054627 RepID=A0ABV7ECY8_9SPHN
MSHRIYAMTFARIHAALLAKVERKGRSREELDAVIGWLTGYDASGIADSVADGRDMAAFFASAPAPNPARMDVTGVVCGVRVENVEEPLMRDIRVLDKLVDELAKGRPLAKVLRQQ